MTAQQHRYATTVTWTGNPGGGTNRRGNHSRNHEIAVEGKPAIPASSDPAFRGDPTRYNPEDLLVASLSACHMLWFLSLCGKAGIAVTGYVDHAEGTMEETPDGGGHFTLVVLRPEITLAPGADRARGRCPAPRGAREVLHLAICQLPGHGRGDLPGRVSRRGRPRVDPDGPHTRTQASRAYPHVILSQGDGVVRYRMTWW